MSIRYRFGVVETIIIINFLFFIPYILSLITTLPFFYNFSLYYLGLNINRPHNFLSVNDGAWWQVITGMFMHGSIGHVIFNMYGLYIFGKPLELRWGGLRFLSFYLTTGILANLASALFYLFISPNSFILIGASGAVYGVLLAFGSYYPNTRLLLFFFIPIKVKWAILIFTIISLVFQFTNIANFIGHLTHLLGFIFAFFYLLIFFKINAIQKMFFSKEDDYIIY